MNKVALKALVILFIALSGCTDTAPGVLSGDIQTFETLENGDGGPAGDTMTPIDQLEVDTGVSDDAPLAGNAIEIFCTVTGLAEGQTPPATSWSIISQPEGALEPEIEGNKVTFFNPGQVRIACTIGATQWTDPTPAIINIAAGTPTSIDTVVTPTTIQAGDIAAVSCTGSDTYGNPILDGWTVAAVPGGDSPGQIGGIVATSDKIKALTVGTYDVRCVAEDGTQDETPVIVTVTPGVPYRLITTLGSETIPCGAETSVKCRAEDKQGNVIADLPMSIALPTKLSLVGLNVTGTVTGKYVVKCVPVGLDWDAFKLDSAVLEVLPGPPVALDLGVMPPKPYFATFELVTVTILATDEWGNLVPDAAITPITVTPDENYKKNTETSFLFKEEGIFTLSTSLLDVPGVAASIDVAIEGAPPSVVVTHPLRGATIEGSKPSVTVEGIAQDKIAGIETVLVNGATATLNPDGSFTQIIVPKWGLNLLQVEAIDGSGASTLIKQSFYFAESYYPMTPEPASVPDAIKMWLSKTFIDDGVHNPNHVDDLATILEALLVGLDLSSALSSQDIGAGYTLYMSDLSFNPPKVDLTPIQGGLHLDLELKNLRINVKLKGVCKVLGVDLCPDFSGKVTVDKIKIKSDFMIAANEGQTTTELKNVEVSMQYVDLDINGILGWLFDWLIDFIVGFFVDDLEKTFEDQVKDQMKDLISDLFEQLAISETFELDGLFPGMEPISLTFTTEIWSAAFDPHGGRIGLAGKFLATQKVPQQILGSIQRGTCLMGLPVNYALPGTEEFEVGLHDDFLNLALTAAWMTGALNLEMDKDALAGEGGLDIGGLPVDDISLSLQFLLPPILNGCNPDGIIYLQVGDLFLDAELTSFLFEGGVGKIGAYMALELSVELFLVEGDEGSMINIVVNDLENLDFHWEYVPAEFEGNEDLLEDLLKEQLMDQLLADLVGESLGEFKIPEIDLGSILNQDGNSVPIVPAIDTLSRQQGHTVVQGYLE